MILSWPLFLGCGVTIIVVARYIYKKATPISVVKKTVVITGASGGLGEACARVFHSAGCKTVLCGRRTGELERVKQSLMSMQVDNDNEPLVVTVDLTKYDEIPSTVENIINSCGRVDILINNAGLSSKGSVLNTELDVYRRVFEINFFGLIKFTKGLLAHMVNSGGGSIVAISSIQGYVSMPYRSAYASSKYALRGFCEALRSEVSFKNIHVGVVSPSYIKTDITYNAIHGDGRRHNQMDESIATGMSPDYAASKVLECVQYQLDDVLIGPLLHVWAPILRMLLPGPFLYLMNKRAYNTRDQEN